MQLSIDARVQFILHEELQKVISEFSAKGGAGIIMDVRTGEIVAMVSLPDFDPNHPTAADPETAAGRRQGAHLQQDHAGRVRDGLGVQDL